jgi:hypothetical protein
MNTHAQVMYVGAMMLTKALGIGLCTLAVSGASAAQPQPWRQSFPVDTKMLATEGKNPYFILEPGYQLKYEGTEDGKPGTLVITVLNETKNVGGVETRIVEERETSGGDLIEVSRNYFAIDPAARDVYYFGEDVDIYKNGKVTSHEGSWQHGTNGARFGLMMPGKPSPGMRFYQEQAKGIAMDRAEIVSLTGKLTTRAGAFERCLKTLETTPLEKLAREYKIYAPGIGLVKDGALELVSHQIGVKHARHHVPGALSSSRSGSRSRLRRADSGSDSNRPGEGLYAGATEGVRLAVRVVAGRHGGSARRAGHE